MHRLLIKHARQVVTVCKNGETLLKGAAMNDVCVLNGPVSVVISCDGHIGYIGEDTEVSQKFEEKEFERIVDATDCCVIPGRNTVVLEGGQGCKLLSDIGQCPTKFGKCPSKSNFDWTLVRSQKDCHIIHFFAVTKSDCKLAFAIRHSSILFNVHRNGYTYLSRDLYISCDVYMSDQI